ncbi:hypothetical protein ABE073_04920 [Lederbergia citrisecunda]|uniref:hypothetical protein n=1 Tax=Lederbergia citrisecunda TaxID=2833583 RepID=UPI003D2C87D0
MSKLSYEEFIVGENYVEAFKIVLRNVLMNHNLEDVDVSQLYNYIEIPFNNEMLLRFYLAKEEFNNDINAYESLFGLDMLHVGKVIFDNIGYIYKQINKRLQNSYREYEEKFIRNMT